MVDPPGTRNDGAAIIDIDRVRRDVPGGRDESNLGGGDRSTDRRSYFVEEIRGRRARRLAKVGRTISAFLVTGLPIVTTPAVEMNPAKALTARVPVVLSMAHVVVSAFAGAVVGQVWRVGVAAWPAATLSISVMLALPVVAALERVRTSEGVLLAKTKLGTFRHGDVRAMGSVYPTPSTAPSKCDEHRSDVQAVAWFSDPRCTNGYTWLVLDDRRAIEVADPAMRTPHAGPRLTPNANASYYGIAAASNETTLVTAAATDASVISSRGGACG